MTLRPALVVEADGGSRGNPGVAGYGALVRDARTRKVLAERAAPLGKASNNVAEYEGLLAGLAAVLDLGLAADASIEVKMDSKLVVEQMCGRWKIKHADMQTRALAARRLIDDIQAAGGTVDFTWVPRDANKEADALSNDGMDGTTVRRDHVRAGAAPGADRGEDVTTATGASPATPRPTPTFGEARVPLEDVFVSDETVPVLDGQTKLVLVRHGVTDFTLSSRLDGRGGSNPPLNVTGLAQARAAAVAVERLLARSDTGRVSVVSSSLQRARQTGQAIADRLGVEREEDRDWDEQAFGDWDGWSMPDLVAAHGDELLLLRSDRDYVRPGGESRREVDARVGAALARAIARGGTVVVATHRIALMSVLARLLGMGHEQAWSVATAPASLSAVEIWPDGGVQIAFVNDTHHLYDPAVEEGPAARVRIIDSSLD